MIDCERWTSTNILWFCKCLCLRHWKHLCSWENLLRQLTFPSKILGNTHFKADVDEFFGVSQISWKSFPWKQLSLVNDQEVNSLLHAKVYVFSDSVFFLLNPTSNFPGEQQLGWSKDSSHYGTLDVIDEEPMEFEWKISQHPPRCSSSKKSKNSWTKWANQKNFKDELSSCRCSMTSYGVLKTMQRSVLLIPHLWLAKRFQKNGHSLDLDPKSGILLTTKDHEEIWIELLNWWWSNSEKADTQFFEPQVHCLAERSKANEETYLDTSVPMWLRLKLFIAHYFCKSGQYPRNSLRFVWGIQYLSNKYGETRIGRAMWPIVRASKLIDNDT